MKSKIVVLEWYCEVCGAHRSVRGGDRRQLQMCIGDGLEGGILNYLELVPEDENLWGGQCFVFDERVSVGHGLKVGEYALCRACRHPIQESDTRSDLYREGVSCPKCHDRTSDEQKARFAERQKQVDLAKARGEQHLSDRIEP